MPLRRQPPPARLWNSNGRTHRHPRHALHIFLDPAHLPRFPCVPALRSLLARATPPSRARPPPHHLSPPLSPLPTNHLSALTCRRRHMAFFQGLLPRPPPLPLPFPSAAPDVTDGEKQQQRSASGHACARVKACGREAVGPTQISSSDVRLGRRFRWLWEWRGRGGRRGSGQGGRGARHCPRSGGRDEGEIYLEATDVL
eukprot:scaffold232241_cov29-Tisochrysis_lutea.AAC.3